MEDPYKSILLYITPEKEPILKLVDATNYGAALKNSEGAHNPGGYKGGVSPTCKAVYMSLAEQKLK